MTFKTALKKLGIEEYEKRIFNSNSNGELFHLADYIVLAEFVGKHKFKKEFKEWFNEIVSEAEKTWNRPESVFQHPLKILEEQLNKNYKK